MASTTKKPRRQASSKNVPRVDGAPAFVLHQYPYRETSKLLEVFSRDHGRLTLVARGAQRPGSQLRGVLLAFQPVLMAWFGAGEVKTLHAAEWQGGMPQLTGLPLLCGFYLNELLLKLLPRDEPHAILFVHYFEAIRALACCKADESVEPILRRFELELIKTLGYAPDWTRSSNGEAVLATQHYAYSSANGIAPYYQDQFGPSIDGTTLLEAASGDFRSEHTLGQAKWLMRQALGALLGDSTLHTRQLLLDLHKL